MNDVPQPHSCRPQREGYAPHSTALRLALSLTSWLQPCHRSAQPAQQAWPSVPGQLPTCLMCKISPPTWLLCRRPMTVSKETAYIHAHFNKISKISKQDFTDMGNIELITPLSKLAIVLDFDWAIPTQENALMKKRLLQHWLMPSQNFEGNELTAVSKLTCITCVFVFFHFFLQNNISTIADEMFCKGDTSHYLRSNLDCVRLNGNPIKLSGYPNGFIRLQSLSVNGKYY
uniref:Uncharacterized protein n=1 Tax=Poecilia reticulata TaxID=8081 RepID=A0A3P9PNP5_POERE